ncbi:bZIP transcription factor 12-like [Lycium barbarum]|uniref:bZIP transcription factor 12-like n=1 Tax=Lycium barbarum TaxID=112863 RepID=UPI00293E174A|nr:bZIP transcription factor 12-like [Lycium barbarum]
MASSSRTPNSDRSSLQNPTSSSSSSLHSDPSRNFGSMNMDEILNNIYSDPTDPFSSTNTTTPTTDVGPNKTVDEVWKEIVAGSNSREPEMTLEDFLTKAGAVTEEDVRVPVSAGGGFVVDNPMNCQFPVGMQSNGPPGGYGNMEPQPHMGYGNGGVVAISATGSGSGRGKRRSTVEELPVDKATQQKQRRMIKNRESAARSRERKQAYTVELESLVTQLEEENARLLREEEEKNKERLKQIMENLMPVVEKRRPPRVLRRVQSMSW